MTTTRANSVLPDNFRIARVDRTADDVLGNLFEHYLHDMAQWFEFDTDRKSHV